jgi:hypothetical protein
MINFNLSLKYYILPYGTNMGGKIQATRSAGDRWLRKLYFN